ncbi:MAG TPA: hypothetical protein VE596_02185 [Gaiellaceae bacterium]|jgi:hypothetical protein|nr:hypothetical protein [Gaiellaceae bacterium]
MRYTRWLAAATAALVLAGLGSAPAGAGGTTNVSILLQAQYVTEVVVSVALHVTCEGNPLPGTVAVTVEQNPPETQSPTVGIGENVVVCDGNQHDVAVTVTGGSFSGFDIGKAFATATLVAPSGTDSDARQISIGF